MKTFIEMEGKKLPETGKNQHDIPDFIHNEFNKDLDMAILNIYV